MPCWRISAPDCDAGLAWTSAARGFRAAQPATVCNVNQQASRMIAHFPSCRNLAKNHDDSVKTSFAKVCGSALTVVDHCIRTRPTRHFRRFESRTGAQEKSMRALSCASTPSGARLRRRAAANSANGNNPRTGWEAAADWLYRRAPRGRSNRRSAICIAEPHAPFGPRPLSCCGAAQRWEQLLCTYADCSLRSRCAA